MIRKALMAAALLAAAGTVSTVAQAQLFRAYLALNGSDANPCTLVQPCRLLPAALTAVADGGEIWMLDSANYNVGLVVVDKSVSILGVPGVVGSLVATQEGDVLRIDAPSAQVSLRNLVFTRMPGVAGSTNGVNLVQGLSLVIEGSTFSKLSYAVVMGAAGSRVQFVDNTVRNGGNGIDASTWGTVSITRSRFLSLTGVAVWLRGMPGAGTLDASVSHSVFARAIYGVVVGTPSDVGATVRASAVGNQFEGGLYALQATSGAGSSGRMTATGNAITSATKGMFASGGGAKIVAGGNTIAYCETGLDNVGGTIESYGDNRIRDNTTNTNGTITTTGVSPG